MLIKYFTHLLVQEDSYLTLLIMYHQYWNITKLERYKPSPSRINSGKKVRKKL